MSEFNSGLSKRLRRDAKFISGDGMTDTASDMRAAADILDIVSALADTWEGATCPENYDSWWQGKYAGMRSAGGLTKQALRGTLVTRA